MPIKQRKNNFEWQKQQANNNHNHISIPALTALLLSCRKRVPYGFYNHDQ